MQTPDIENRFAAAIAIAVVAFLSIRLQQAVRSAAQQQAGVAVQQAQEFARVNRIMIMGELTASISHEINQPLAGIIANVGTCLRYLTAPEPNLDATRQYLEYIARDGRRAAEIISRVRGLVRRAVPSKNWTDVNEAVTEAATLIQSQLNRQQTRLKFELSDRFLRFRPIAFNCSKSS